MTSHWVTVGFFALTLAAGGRVGHTQQLGTLKGPDKRFVVEAAEGGQMEVGLGELAQEKAANDAVRGFGRRMVDDHSRANQELARLAASKQIEPATKPFGRTQREKDFLSKLSGSAFDLEYVRMMVRDHEKDVIAFRQESQQTTDPELRAWVARTLPTLEHHLTAIRQIASQVAGK